MTQFLTVSTSKTNTRSKREKAGVNNLRHKSSKLKKRLSKKACKSNQRRKRKFNKLKFKITIRIIQNNLQYNKKIDYLSELDSLLNPFVFYFSLINSFSMKYYQSQKDKRILISKSSTNNQILYYEDLIFCVIQLPY